MRRIWGLEERLFKDDLRKRMMLFRYLVLGRKFGDGRKGGS